MLGLIIIIVGILWAGAIYAANAMGTGGGRVNNKKISYDSAEHIIVFGCMLAAVSVLVDSIK